MIRPFTCLCLLLAAGSGLYTYQAKHASELLDRDIARVLKAADAARQRAAVLHAEYALLNDPSRLADLANAHLPALRSTEPGQFTTLAELDRRLPAVGTVASPVPLTEPAEPPTDLPVAAAPIASRVVTAAAASAAAAGSAAHPPTLHAAPVLLASNARPMPPLDAAQVASTAVAAPAALWPPAPVKPAAKPAAGRTLVASNILPPLRQAGTSHTVPPAIHATPAAARPLPPVGLPIRLITPVAAPPIQVGSALGMARLLAPAAMPP